MTTFETIKATEKHRRGMTKLIKEEIRGTLSTKELLEIF